MNIKIITKKNFKVKDFTFGYSIEDDIDSVENWQDGNNVFNIEENGIYFCFARKKNNGAISRMVVGVSCGEVANGCFIEGNMPFVITTTSANCTITTVSPYSNITVSNSCTITSLSVFVQNQSTVPVDNSTGTGIVSKLKGVTKLVPVETTKGKYNPHLFPKVGIVDTIDPVLNVSFPNWIIAWQCEGKQFKDNNRQPKDLGIPFMYDVNPTFYGGIGVRGVDFVYEFDPNNGCPWGQVRNSSGVCEGTIDNIDDEVNKNILTFDSAIPFNRRAYANFGLAGAGNKQRWDNATLSQCYFDGKNASSSAQYGKGGSVNGRAKTGLTNADIEIGYELGQTGTNKHLAFLKGMDDGVQGFCFSQYSGAFMDIDIAPEAYEREDGTYEPYRLKIDRTQKLGDNNQPVASQIPTSSDWQPNTVLNIPDLGISNVTIKNLTRTLICVEVSSLASEALRNKSVYDKTGNGNFVTVNKYGINRNTQHIVAYTKFLAEVNRAWSDKHLSGRRVILQSKITCDRANMGIFIDAGFTNKAYEFYHHDRRTSFLIGGFTAMSGCEWQLWDRNTDQYLDGYHGAFGLINLFKQRKDFGGGIAHSYETLKPKAKWLLHNSEISYDDGQTWHKETADKYVMDKLSILHSQALTDDGYWLGFFGRPEGEERTSCRVRVKYNNKFYYHSITADMWDTVSYAHKDKPLSQIPDLDKDYYFFIFKLENITELVDTTPTQSTLVSPTVSKNLIPTFTGQSVILSATGCTGSYQWLKNNVVYASTASITVSAQNSDSYTCKCISGSSSSLASSSITFAGLSTPSQSQNVPFFLFFGESNSVGEAPNTSALSTETGFRSKVKIWNPNSNAFETLNIGVNNNNGTGTANTTHGFELGIANLLDSGYYNKSEVYMAKMAFGGAMVRQFLAEANPRPNYWDAITERMSKIKTALSLANKNPTFYVVYSQGINDKVANLIDVTEWGTQTQSLQARIRENLGVNALICMTKFAHNTLDFTDYNNKIASIASTGVNIKVVESQTQPRQSDDKHWTYAGYKEIAKMIIDKITE